MIPQSPMDGRRFRMPMGRNTTPKPVWGAREVAEALSRKAFQDSQLFALWAIMCGGGLSRSEALAIDWESIRWESALGMDAQEYWTAYVSIDSAVTTEDGLKGPKNSRRYRSVPIPSIFANPLHAIRSSGPICQSTRYTRDGGRPTGHRLTPDRGPSCGSPISTKAYASVGPIRLDQPHAGDLCDPDVVSRDRLNPHQCVPGKVVEFRGPLCELTESLPAVLPGCFAIAQPQARLRIAETERSMQARSRFFRIFRSGMVFLATKKQAARSNPLYDLRFYWSGGLDSNQRPLDPQGAILDECQ